MKTFFPFLFLVLLTTKVYSFPIEIFSKNPFTEFWEKEFEDTSVKTNWSQKNNKKIFTIIHDSGNDSPLNVDISDGMIHIHGKMVKKEKVETNQGSSESYYVSQISQKYGIPKDVKEEQAKIISEKGKIIIEFPRKKVSSSSSMKTIPLKDVSPNIKGPTI